ncbi:hypothetical protein X769_19405 [Mesorhizobium sp. LSJC268A00]|nr:hypothetical protein X773_06535 [Mesorhizobium sp. LSJC285A00]ESX02614.1 hypothetical protein X769_19405 [Mesorhizobium sp. LSJC268A00]ESX18704.1 hypothetical protein X766_13160 [Mesorhizobium sp. LSJC255A00]ESX28059.1 hypothetical protein X765_18795 [Mesorhizobium sp. LSHC440B00]ESX34504.1 hypothetical protein X763_22120 [Mesorhizobium sp. LSHC432A00]ESX40599.1 hypothetical protein X764_19200 [Mesorhizobium sp. LSHC440A00]ESX72713.1 hypothetical protein X757_20940 [Mesorhizobium sp. LSHC4
MKDRWEPDHQFIESARRSQLRAESQLDSLQSTIAETRRVLEASRKLLEKIGNGRCRLGMLVGLHRTGHCGKI